MAFRTFITFRPLLTLSTFAALSTFLTFGPLNTFGPLLAFRTLKTLAARTALGALFVFRRRGGENLFRRGSLLFRLTAFRLALGFLFLRLGLFRLFGLFRRSRRLSLLRFVLFRGALLLFDRSEGSKPQFLFRACGSKERLEIVVAVEIDVRNVFDILRRGIFDGLLLCGGFRLSRSRLLRNFRNGRVFRLFSGRAPLDVNGVVDVPEARVKSLDRLGFRLLRVALDGFRRLFLLGRFGGV